jgi:hypothetical protein
MFREKMIKREDIRLFDPHYEDPDDKGIIVDGKNLILEIVIVLRVAATIAWQLSDARYLSDRS